MELPIKMFIIITVFHFAEDNKVCDLLVFETGLGAIPPLGIEPSPTLAVDHPDDDGYDHSRGVPFAKTCANCLHIPVLADYELLGRGSCWHWRSD